MDKILYLVSPTVDFNSVKPESVFLNSTSACNNSKYFHTSLHDMPVEKILLLAPEFDKIDIWVPGFDINSDVYKETLLLHSYLSSHITKDAEKTFLTDIKCQERYHSRCVWVFGCSHSYGVGLESDESNYGELLAKSLDLPLRLVAKPGSSLQWSTRHLFSSAIESQDIVIWQITSPDRVTRFDGTKVQELQLTQCKDRSIIDSLPDTQIYFEHFSLIDYGVRYLKSIGCTFRLISFIGKRNYHELDYLSRYMNYKEYCPTTDLFVDCGTDRLHPGPITHKNLALRLVDCL